MKIRKCKCCGQWDIVKRCFIKKFSKEEKCNAYKLWYEKKSQILCDDCYDFIPKMALKMDIFEYDSLQQSINSNNRKNTRIIRFQTWYLLDIGLLDIKRFEKK